MDLMYSLEPMPYHHRIKSMDPSTCSSSITQSYLDAFVSRIIEVIDASGHEGVLGSMLVDKCGTLNGRRLDREMFNSFGYAKLLDFIQRDPVLSKAIRMVRVRGLPIFFSIRASRCGTPPSRHLSYGGGDRRQAMWGAGTCGHGSSLLESSHQQQQQLPWGGGGGMTAMNDQRGGLSNGNGGYMPWTSSSNPPCAPVGGSSNVWCPIIDPPAPVSTIDRSSSSDRSSWMAAPLGIRHVDWGLGAEPQPQSQPRVPVQSSTSSLSMGFPPPVREIVSSKSIDSNVPYLNYFDLQQRDQLQQQTAAAAALNIGDIFTSQELFKMSGGGQLVGESGPAPSGRRTSSPLGPVGAAERADSMSTSTTNELLSPLRCATSPLSFGLKQIVLQSPPRLGDATTSEAGSCSGGGHPPLLNYSELKKEEVGRWGRFGTIEGDAAKPIYLNTSDPFCLVAIGLQGPGRDLTIAAVIEGCVKARCGSPSAPPSASCDTFTVPTVGDSSSAEEPLASPATQIDEDSAAVDFSIASPPLASTPKARSEPALVLTQHSSPTYAFVMHFSRNPHSMCQISGAAGSHLPALSKVAVLVSPSFYQQRVQQYRHCANVTVIPALLEWKDLSALDLKSLMRVEDEGDETLLFAATLLDMLRQYQRTQRLPTFEAFQTLCMEMEWGLGGMQACPLKQRLSLLESVVRESELNRDLPYARLADLVQDGYAVVADLTDPMIGAPEACAIFQVLLRQYLCAPSTPGGKLVVLDEAQEYLLGGAGAGRGPLDQLVVETARQMESLAVRVAVCAKSPACISEDLLDLAGISVLQTFHANEWFSYLERKLAMQAYHVEQVLSLKLGEALVFSPRSKLATGEDGVSVAGRGWHSIKIGA